jgi:hypothetical protein
VKIRIWKSLTFVVGLVLFLVGAAVVLFAGSVFNPPPYRIVIALEDIEPYTILDAGMLATDEQTMHERVASRLIHESELDVYVGGLVVETIHAGEPLRRNAVVAPDNPAYVHRLSLALAEPDMVAAVVPVSPKVIPDNVTAGDYVNITMGIEGSIASLTTEVWGLPGGEAGGASPGEYVPWPVTSTLPLTMVESLPPEVIGAGEAGEPGEEEVGATPEETLKDLMEVQPPLNKIVLPHLQVIDVGRDRVPNPNYGMSMGEGGGQEPAFLEGDIESITVLVPMAAEELLYFAVDNGNLHISVVPHAAVVEGSGPTTGVMWEDIVEFFKEERLRARGVVTETMATGSTPETSVLPTEPLTGTTGVLATPTAAPEGALPTATSAASGEGGSAGTEAAAVPPAHEVGAESGTSASSEPAEAEKAGGGLMAFVVPAFIGSGVVLVLGLVGMLIVRRRQKE